MKRSGPSVAERTLRLALLAAGAAAIAFYAYAALRRMSFPYDLEWIEGGVLQHVERVDRGEPLYREPALDFTALLYAPLYYYVGAALGQIFEIGLPLLRAISFAASLGVMALTYLLVRRETGSRAGGVVAAGLFAGCYDLSGGWFDLARVDSLFLLLLMATLVVARFAERRRGAAAAAVLLVLATYAKQQAAVALPALFVFLLFARRDRGMALTFGGVAVIGLAGVHLIANAATDGWFAYYFLDLASQHPWATEYVRLFFTEDLEAVAPALLACALALALWVRARDRERLAFYLPLGLALAGGSYLSRVHEGGYPNVVLPTYLLVAILAGIAVAAVARERRALALAVPAVLLVQFALFAYDPGRYIPSEADRERSDRAVAALRSLGGHTYVPSYPIYARRAGLPEYVHTAPALDVLRADPTPEQRRFRARYEGMIRAGCFAQVVAASWPQEHYRRERELLPGERVEPVSGLSVPLGAINVPRRPADPSRASCPPRPR